jgi:uncharacterized protein YcfL
MDCLKSPNQALKILFGLTAAILLNGCASSAGVVASQDASGQTTTTVYNDNLGILVRQIRSSPAGGLFKARVIVENETNATQSLQYQFNWYDQQGDELNADGQAWSPFYIYGHNQKSLSSLAPSPEAVQFRVAIRDLSATKTFKTNFLGLK